MGKKYVCVVRNTAGEIVYGKNSGNGAGRSENFETNGKRAYDSVSEACAALFELRETKGYRNLRIAEVRGELGNGELELSFLDEELRGKV